MKLTRRDFLKTTGAVAATTAIIVITPPFTAFTDRSSTKAKANLPESPRQIAFRMKDRLTHDFQEIKRAFPADYNADRQPKYSWRSTSLGKQWMKDLDIFMDHLVNNITGPNKTFKEMRDETRMILKGQLRDGTKMDIDIMTCTVPAFVTCLIRDCLVNEQLPLIPSNGWDKFAEKYSKYVLSV